MIDPYELADEIQNMIEESARMGEPPSFSLDRHKADWLVSYLRRERHNQVAAECPPELCNLAQHTINALQGALYETKSAAKEQAYVDNELILALTEVVEAASEALNAESLSAGHRAGVLMQIHNVMQLAKD